MTHPKVTRRLVVSAAQAGLEALACLHAAGLALGCSTASELLEKVEATVEPQAGDIAVDEVGLSIVASVFHSGVGDRIIGAHEGRDVVSDSQINGIYFSIRPLLEDS